MNALKTVFVALAVGLIVLLARPVQAQETNTVTLSNVSGSDSYATISIDGDMNAFDIPSTDYQTQACVFFTSVEFRYVNYFGVVLSDDSYAVGSNSSYPNDTISYGGGWYTEGQDIPVANGNTCIPGDGKTSWYGQMSYHAPSGWVHVTCFFHYSWFLQCNDQSTGEQYFDGSGVLQSWSL